MPTTNPVPSQDPSDLLFNAGKLDEVLNGTGTSFTDRLGTARRTMAGIDAAADLVLGGLGYAPPVAYAAGIALTLTTQTVEYSGEVFAPKVSVLPFTTSGTFETAKFRLIQGVASADLPALVGQDLQDYAELRAYAGRATRIYITGLLVSAKPAAIAGVFQYDPTDTTSADNGGTIIVGADGRRWKRDYTGSIKSVWFGVAADGSIETQKIQTAIDSLDDFQQLDLCGMQIRVAKGAASALYPSNDQPCVVLYDKKGVSIENGHLYVNEHGQSIIDFKSCTDCILKNVTLVGAGNFPQIDGTTGRAEKGAPGTPDAGYYNYTLYNSSVKKNNSIDTSGYSTGGYGGAFPQWGGGTALTWGVWNGGFIGNYGFGVSAITCNGFTVIGCEIYGFNGSGVYVRETSNSHILQNKIHDNYLCGVEFSSTNSGKNAFVRFNEIYDNGHPNASVSHADVDPGYGIATNNGVTPIKNLIVSGNVFRGNRRKGVDAHSVDGMTVTENKIENSGFGVYVGPGISGNIIGNVNVSNNEIKNIQYGTGQAALGIYVIGNPLNLNKSAVINGNILDDVGVPFAQMPISETGTSISVGSFNNISVTGNTIRNGSTYAGASIAAPASAGSESRQVSVTGNTISGFSRIGITAGAGATTSNAVAVNGNVINLANVAEYSNNQYGIFAFNNKSCSGNQVALATPGALIGDFYGTGGTISFVLALPTLAVSQVRQSGMTIPAASITATSTAQGFLITLGSGFPYIVEAMFEQASSTLIRTSDSAIVSTIYRRDRSTTTAEIGLIVNDFVAKTSSAVAGSASTGSLIITLIF